MIEKATVTIDFHADTEDEAKAIEAVISAVEIGLDPVCDAFKFDVEYSVRGGNDVS
jgi:hypothetical protein